MQLRASLLFALGVNNGIGSQKLTSYRTRRTLPWRLAEALRARAPATLDSRAPRGASEGVTRWESSEMAGRATRRAERANTMLNCSDLREGERYIQKRQRVESWRGWSLAKRSRQVAARTAGVEGVLYVYLNPSLCLCGSHRHALARPSLGTLSNGICAGKGRDRRGPAHHHHKRHAALSCRPQLRGGFGCIFSVKCPSIHGMKSK